MIPSNTKLVNLGGTNIDYADLKSFMPYAKYLWIDNTSNLSDSLFASSIQMLLADEARSEYDQPMRDTFTKDIPFLQSLHIMQRSNLLTNTFSLTEFLLSKSSVLNQGLSVLEPLLTKHFSPYINLTVFKNISKEIIRKILYNEKIRENMFSLKFDFKML